MPFSIAPGASTAPVVVPTAPSDSSLRLSAAPTTCFACPARAHGACSALSDQALPEMAAIAQTKGMAAGGTLVHEGDDAGAIHTVVSGMLKIFKTLPDGRQQITGFATVGDTVGLVHGSAHVYTAEAITSVVTCRVGRRPLSGVIARNPAVQARLLAITSLELAAAQEQILLLGCKRGAERVCSFLLTLARRNGHDCETGRPVIALPMLKTDMGAYLGLRPETISRILRRLEDAGAITRTSNVDIRLDDLTFIQDLAHGGE